MAAVTLDEATWRGLRSAHESRVDAWLGPHLRRRSAGAAHPVEDFLFTYYSHSAAALRRWHPGRGVLLSGDVEGFRSVKGYLVTQAGAEVDLALTSSRVKQVRSTHQLLRATAGRPAALSCFGLHEWAMVYRQPADEIRHGTYPLRLGRTGTDTVVEQHRISCTHHDAFRFFTPPARPRNALQPTRDSQRDLEQPGCLHATMDLYKWAYQLSPLVSAELVADCFELARDVRVVDMQAAPYDLSILGVEPMCIETPEGKTQYVAAQRGFAARGGVLRERLAEVCELILTGPRD